MFELQYEPLIINKKQQSWEIAVIPWDTETFGFGVSSLRPFSDGCQREEMALVEKTLKAYSKDKQVLLITASIPIEEKAIFFLLQRAGFRFIDLSLSIRYENLEFFSEQKPSGLSLNPATSEETGILIETAGVSFQHGRYHLDPMVPNSLADQRYRDWLSRCCNLDNPQQVLTLKFHDTICGFSVVECTGSEGYMHLHAIDSKWRGKKLGQSMIIQSLRYLHNSGAKIVGTKISASNLKALNLHSQMDGRFVKVDRLLHWHYQKQ